MFALFELAKVLQFVNNDGDESLKLLNHAWTEHERRSLLALYFSNGYLLLWYSHIGKPIIRQLSWFPNRHILCMSYDPSSSWLLCCVKDALIIVPALFLVDPQADVLTTWAKDDLTEIKIDKIKGQANSCKWWQTQKDEPVAILATNSAYLYFINLLTKQLLYQLSLDEQIANLTIMHDDGAVPSTSVLITTKGNVLWKLLLEQMVNTSELTIDNKQEWNTATYQPVVNYHQYNHWISILDRDDNILEEVAPKELYQFPPSVILSVQHVKHSACITTYDFYSNVLQVYDSNMEQSPLYVYHLPDTTDSVLLTDRFLFLTSVEIGQVLSVVANQLAEAVPNKSDRGQAVIQHFQLPQDEHIVTLYRQVSSSENYCLELYKETITDGLPVTCEDALPSGCILLTNKAVYVCRPRISPAGLFLKLVFEDVRFKEAERLAYILGLDINCLYRIAAESCLVEANCSKAMTLLDRMKYPSLDRLQLLLIYGFVEEAMLVLMPLLSNRGTKELSSSENVLLAKYAVICYVHQIASGQTELCDTFRSFLLTNYYIDKTEALLILLRSGLHAHFVEFMLERDVFLEGMQLLLNYNRLDEMPLNSPYNLIELPHNRSDEKKITRDLLQLLDTHQLIVLLEEDPYCAEKITSVLQNNLCNLSEEQLLHVVATLDFSKSIWNKWCHLVLLKGGSRSRHDSSEDSNASFDHKESPEVEAFKQLVMLLLFALVYLNQKRVKDGSCLFLSNGEDYDKLHKNMLKDGPVPPRDYVFIKPTLLSCGVDFTALIKNGNVFTWGSTSDGKLGHGDLNTTYVCTPQRVKFFDDIKIQVLSVACGRKHCLTLTENGVYAWGSNTYGQLGNGTRCNSSIPIHVEYLDTEKVASVSCGHYHSLALTHDFRVYSWGWGVHGQLGHGDPNDRYIPEYINALQSYRVVMVAAGSTHTAVLTAEGLVYMFGGNNFGQLGNGKTCKSTRPVLVGSLKEPVVMLSTQFFHTLALSESGKLYCWGISPVQLKRKMSLVRGRKGASTCSNQKLFNKCLVPGVVYSKHIKGQIVKLCCGLGFSAVLTDIGGIYTWGMNDHGELATGDKMEEPVPNQVRKLSEVKVITAAAGSNFVIAMDCHGLLHGWGNNDYGQLAMKPRHPSLNGRHVSKQVPGLLGRPYLNMLMDTSSVVEPVQIYNSMPSTTDNPDQHNEQFIYAVTGQEWWLEKLTWLPYLLSSDGGILPNLAGSGPIIYPPKAIVEVLMHLPQWCSSQEVLNLSMEIEAWDITARILWLMQEPNLALQYHLKYVASIKKQLGTAFEDKVFIYLQHYASLFIKLNIEELVDVCCHILQFWDDKELSTTRLRSFFEKNHCHSALPLFLSLIITDKWNLFNPDFCVRILSESMKLVDRSTSDYVRQYCSKILAQFSGLTSPNSVVKGNNSQNVIHVPGLEFMKLCDLLKQQLNEDEKASPGTDHYESEPADDVLVAFSCGHHCSKEELLLFHIPELELKLAQNEVPLKQTAALLSDQYRSLSVMNLACPCCVYKSLTHVVTENF